MPRWCGVGGLLLWLGGTAAAIVVLYSGIITQPVKLRLADGTSIHGTLYRDRSQVQPGPVVVVVHGTALAHASCAPGLSIPLARNGNVVLAIDQRGHGHSGGSLPQSEYDNLETMLRTAADQPELEAAIGFLQAQPCAEAQRIALVGHSRGGWAAANVGYSRADIGSVVAICCAPATCDLLRPRNFLLLAAGDDELIPVEDCVAAIARAMPAPTLAPGVRYGDQELGTARQLIVADWSNHLSPLADPSTTRRMVQWVAWSFQRDPGPVPGDRLLVASYAVLFASIGGVVASVWLLCKAAAKWLPWDSATTRNHVCPLVMILLGLLLLAAPLGAWLGQQLPTFAVLFSPQVVALFLVLAILSLGVNLAARYRNSTGPERIVPGTLGRGILLGMLALGLGLTWLVTTWGTTWLDLMPTPRRAVLGLVFLALLLPCCLTIAHGLQRAVGPTTATATGAVIRGLLWLGVPLALRLSHALFLKADHSFFVIPLSFVAVSFVLALPLWLLPNRPGMTLARGVSHAGMSAWLLACHLPFVHAGS